MIDRRTFLLASTGAAAAALAGATSAGARADEPAHSPPTPAPDATLAVQPTRVFKVTADQDRLQLQRWLFTLVVLSPEPRKRPIASLVVRYHAGIEVRRVTTYDASATSALDLVPAVPESPARPRYPVAAFQIADAMPAALAVDRASCEVTWRTTAGKREQAVLDVPLETYTQRTGLIFPFQCRGLITQGGAWNDGHRNRSGMFAIDAIGLTDGYAMMVSAGDAPAATAGWGRPILAPAAGVVVAATGDRPDQPVTGVSDPAFFAPAFPQGGDPGNHCVIDHGDGEFSLLAHLQQGTLRVRVGESVRQGQVMGLMGNSGDSNSPHVHHQLQSGADWMTADALPHHYDNGPMKRRDRGEIFEAV